MSRPESRNAPLGLWAELADVPFSQRFVDAGGFRTRVIEAGEGPDLVLMHGTGGHCEAFLRNLRSLSRDFHVVIFDLAGHGYTTGPDKPYTLDVYADHLEALLDALGLDRPLLSGESLGGWVAAWFAASRPERVERTVLAVPGNVTMKTETMQKLKESTRKAVVEASPENVRTRLEWLFGPDNKHMVTEELVRVRYDIYTQPGAQKRIENVLVLQNPEVRKQYTWAPEWCGQIKAPTLILWTEHDPTGPVSEGELLNEWIPGSELTVMSAAGHWPQWERPEEFERIHKEFLLSGKSPEGGGARKPA